MGEPRAFPEPEIVSMVSLVTLHAHRYYSEKAGEGRRRPRRSTADEDVISTHVFAELAI